MTDISISHVVNISVASTNLGVNAYNTSNLAIVTGEPVLAAIQTLAFSAEAASGAFVLTFGTLATSSISWNATAATIQQAINAVSGLESVVVSGSIASQSLTLTQPGNLGPITIPTITTNTLKTSGSVAITITPKNTSVGWSGGALGYAIYVDPTQVGKDFGTSSRTYEMANNIFGQQPNILAGGGQLIVILRNVTQQTIAFSANPTSGTFTLTYNANTTAPIAYNATSAEIQTALQLLPGLSGVQVNGSIQNELLTVIFTGVYGQALALTATSSLDVGSVQVTLSIATTVVGESYGDVITRTQGLVQYFGVMPTETVTVLGQTDTLAAASIILPLKLIGFNVSYNQSDIQPGGIIDLLTTGSFSNSRGLFYGDPSNGGINAVTYMAAYAGSALSVNFNGSNTTTTMNLRTLRGIQVDPSMNETIYNLAFNAGADIYVSYEGAPSVVSNGANQFFDEVYNLKWFIGALQVAGFNYLAQTSTKIPQTEEGMDGLKGAYAAICKQAVTNQYSAPGAWTSSTTFGNQALFLQNISQFGYYIYSQPISQQLATARQARQAPLCQIALKAAGAIQESSVIVYVNQ